MALEELKQKLNQLIKSAEDLKNNETLELSKLVDSYIAAEQRDRLNNLIKENKE